MKRILTVLCGLTTVVTLHAQTIAQWTFEGNFAAVTGTSATLTYGSPETGSGTASGVHASGSTAWSSPAGDGSPHSFSSSFWTVGDYYQFQTATTGFTGIQLDWDQTSSSTGPGRALLQWSVNGTAFNNVGGDYTILQNGLAPNAAWNSTTYVPAYHYAVNLTSIPSVNNQPAVYFRLVDDSTTSAGGGTVGTGGTDRVDNFTVSVAAVPEPASLALFGLGLTGLMVWRRRN